ncbi:protein CASPARIAN STRIP INTEGRITY FACTOR 1 isoform X2 [Populus trichocarpa]|uniref:protein CASPARIAN STRIP INTEGRITY FACTOR 1 isoform X2 n=1 Tax=Populus trichocarpa TaxID=3694 RepID=UPI000CCD2019|nr:protein CASPARIAN STRIP INTEGRITY FACTOR 1 isoform X2 [Populus trichocarpa]|eukprot:XP_024464219.1 protein CASPARIAN STRIP INTEGRITY FACTOR 1 isoform X2 [Populus trichocarpa]
MGLMLLKKISLLFLLISASFLSTSFAGRRSKSVNKLAEEVEEISSKPSHNNEATTIHERLLKANTKDYGNYKPAPALVRPPFKLIPN